MNSIKDLSDILCLKLYMIDKPYGIILKDFLTEFNLYDEKSYEQLYDFVINTTYPNYTIFYEKFSKIIRTKKLNKILE